MTAAELWTEVKADYDEAGLVQLTNPNDRAATTVDDTSGEAAAQGVINLWPAWAQAEYDQQNALHVEVAEMGVIAILWRRGGTATTIEQVKWDEVFSDEGMIARVRNTGPRGHGEAKSNSGTATSSELTSSGRRALGWSDRKAMPSQFLIPRRVPEEN